MCAPIPSSLPLKTNHYVALAGLDLTHAPTYLPPSLSTHGESSVPPCPPAPCFPQDESVRARVEARRGLATVTLQLSFFLHILNHIFIYLVYRHIHATQHIWRSETLGGSFFLFLSYESLTHGIKFGNRQLYLSHPIGSSPLFEDDFP